MKLNQNVIQIVQIK